MVELENANLESLDFMSVTMNPKRSLQLSGRATVLYTKSHVLDSFRESSECIFEAVCVNDRITFLTLFLPSFLQYILLVLKLREIALYCNRLFEGGHHVTYSYFFIYNIMEYNLKNDKLGKSMLN